MLGERWPHENENPIAFGRRSRTAPETLPRFRGRRGAQRRALAERACAELKIHAALEAEIFYPAARAALGTKGGSIVKRAEAEHAAAARLIAALEDPASDDISYADDFARLAALVKHHIEREEREIFARFRQCSPDLGSIAARLRRRKDAPYGQRTSPAGSSRARRRRASTNHSMKRLRGASALRLRRHGKLLSGKHHPHRRRTMGQALLAKPASRARVQKALVATALRFGNALRRFETRRRRRGYDYSCSRLLDEVRLSRSLLLVLADEVGRGGIRPAAAPH